ncbi:MAG TPA: FAD-dependent oxidoreductase [Stellaceae bacterium]|nr:FAD-dependent oxidoreductase [Stellaceae bacterium]
MSEARLKGRSIAVVGAGIAGLAAARGLVEEGADVAVFDKGRQPGGRVATLRAADLAFDHGAQFATAHGLDFAALVAGAETHGQAGSWVPRHMKADNSGALSPGRSTETYRVGVPAMSELARVLAQDLSITQEARVTDLERGGGSWNLRFADGTGRDSFDHVVLALPAPQIVPLITGIADFVTTVSATIYAPCWAVMAAFAEPLGLAVDALTIDDTTLAWAARDSSKPGRPAVQDCWVLHASPEWSRTHIEAEADAIAVALLARFQDLFGQALPAPMPEPSHLAAHRWRYALVEQAADVPCLWDASLGIGACGDWCIGPRVEAAFDSGTAMAKTIAEG